MGSPKPHCDMRSGISVVSGYHHPMSREKVVLVASFGSEEAGELIRLTEGTERVCFELDMWSPGCGKGKTVLCADTYKALADILAKKDWAESEYAYENETVEWIMAFIGEHSPGKRKLHLWNRKNRPKKKRKRLTGR